MKARLAKKIVKASPLYHEYCLYFHKNKQCKQLYWIKKYRNLVWLGFAPTYSRKQKCRIP